MIHLIGITVDRGPTVDQMNIVVQMNISIEMISIFVLDHFINKTYTSNIYWERIYQQV